MLELKRQAAPSCNRAAAPRRSSFPTFPLWRLERAAAASRLTIPTSSTLPIWAAGREARTRGGDPDAVQTLTRGVLRPCRPRRTHARTDGRTHARTHVPPAASPLFSSPSRLWPRPPPPPRPSLRGSGSRPALRRRSRRSWPVPASLRALRMSSSVTFRARQSGQCLVLDWQLSVPVPECVFLTPHDLVLAPRPAPFQLPITLLERRRVRIGCFKGHI